MCYNLFRLENNNLYLNLCKGGRKMINRVFTLFIVNIFTMSLYNFITLKDNPTSENKCSLVLN